MAIDLLSAHEYVEQFRDMLDMSTLPGETKALNVSDFILKHTRHPGAGKAHLPYSFLGHEWQEDVLNDMACNQVDVKASQIGFTEIIFRKALALSSWKGLNVGYVMPTQVLINRMAKARVYPLIQRSPKLKAMLKGQFQTSILSFTNDACFNLFPSGSEKARVAMALDAVIQDEFDRCDEENHDMWPQRLEHSEYKINQKFSTPTLPEIGIHFEFLASDQKYWLIKCVACGKYQDMGFPGLSDADKGSIFFKKGTVGMPEFNLDMPERLGIEKNEWLDKFLAREPYLGCVHCEAPLERTGKYFEWVAKFPSRSISGRKLTRFHIPKVGNFGHDAESIIKSFFAVKKLKEFVNQGLAEPYVTADDQIVLTDVLNARALEGTGFDTFVNENMGMCFTGYDQGKKVHHVTIGVEHPHTIRVLNVGEFSLANDALVGTRDDTLSVAVNQGIGVMESFYSLQAVCDSAPDISFPRGLANQRPEMVKWSTFSESVKDFSTPSEGTYGVNVNRNWMLGEICSLVKRTHPEFRLVFPSHVNQLTVGMELIQHLQVNVREEYEEKNARTGVIENKLVWRRKSSRHDHYAMALGYALVAFFLYSRQNEMGGGFGQLVPPRPYIVKGMGKFAGG